MTARLILLARYPRAGEAKTRLIPELGPEGAATLHRELTEHTLSAMDEGAGGVPYDIEVRYTGARPDEMKAWLGPHRVSVDQGDGDLGARLARSADDAFAQGAERVALIGADCPELSAGILKRAFDLLITADVVLGPALDGGYYLVGVRRAAWDRARRPLFSDMDWGTDEVLSETQRRADARGLSVQRLRVLGDVDRAKDLPLWQRVRKKKNRS